ncbi:MAG: PD40 domain-containing protein [Anaerolineales bacterium]|nr:PD40 domain-containing protein [Anaerolineales bacterium]
MKRFLLLTLLFLTACSSPSATPASFFNVTPAPFNLSLESTPEQIQKAMLESAAHWTTLQMSGTVIYYLPDGSTQTVKEQVWLDPITSRYRVEVNGFPGIADQVIKISDGSTIYNTNLNTGSAETFAFPDSARAGQYIPPLQPGTAYPNPIWGQIGTPLSQLAFPSDMAQNIGTFKPVGTDLVAGRGAVIVEWTFIENSLPSWKAWLDTQTGLILKMQEFGKGGGTTLQAERAVESMVLDGALDASLFAIPGVVQATSQAPAESNPVITESGPTSAEEAGELYFFLQPRQQGQAIELVKVSGVCVYDSANCPPLEKIPAPFPFNFTINALSWSPDGKFAAFSYSDEPSGTPTKLWIFDADAKTWKAIAQAPYLDPPFWSPDGSWVAFRSQDGVGGEDVHVVHPDGSGLKSVAVGLPAAGRPYIMDGWFTDSILMRSALPGTSTSVYLVRAEDGQARPMFEAALTKSQFVVSPDAKFLAYDDLDINMQLHSLKVMQPDGSNAATIAQFTGGSIYPLIWSPDGSLLAFNYYNLTNAEPSAEVYVIRRTGENLSLLYKGNTVGRLLFSPNGKYLLVEETTSASGGHLFLIDLATLNQSMLQAPGLSTDYDWYAPSWRP